MRATPAPFRARLVSSALALTVMGVAGLAFVSGAQSTGIPRLVGRYSTVTEVVSVYHNATSYPGESTLRIWTFTPHCSSGGCTTTLLRPSIDPRSKGVWPYKLRPIGSNRYRAERSDPDSCQVRYPNGKVSVLRNSFIDYGTVTIHPTRASNGVVTAYDGTFLWRAVPQAAARAHGCRVTGRVLTIFRGVKR